MLVCSYLGDRVGLVGLEIVATGKFEPAEGTLDLDPGGVLHEGVEVPAFDVAAVVGRLREGRWAV
jgi:hypothetical protein